MTRATTKVIGSLSKLTSLDQMPGPYPREYNAPVENTRHNWDTPNHVVKAINPRPTTTVAIVFKTSSHLHITPFSHNARPAGRACICGKKSQEHQAKHR